MLRFISVFTFSSDTFVLYRPVYPSVLLGNDRRHSKQTGLDEWNIRDVAAAHLTGKVYLILDLVFLMKCLKYFKIKGRKMKIIDLSWHYDIVLYYYIFIFQTFWIEYMDQIAQKIGVRPNFTKLFFEDPYLATRCFFGPCLPTQFRLEGPGKWNGAKRCIQGAISRCMKPPHKGLQPINFIKSKTRRLSIEIQVPNFIKPYFVLFVLCFLFMCLLFV